MAHDEKSAGAVQEGKVIGLVVSRVLVSRLHGTISTKMVRSRKASGDGLRLEYTIGVSRTEIRAYRGAVKPWKAV